MQPNYKPTDEEIINEQWRPVVGCDKYQVSNLGRIRNLSGKIMKTVTNNCGYQQLFLRVETNKRRAFCVHKLVMTAFVGPPPDAMQIDHVNGEKSDNRLSNLEYVTAAENIRRAIKLGLHNSVGINNGRAKLTEQEVIQIKTLLRQIDSGEITLTRQQVADRMGTYRQIVNHIAAERTWKHVRLSNN